MVPPAWLGGGLLSVSQAGGQSVGDCIRQEKIPVFVKSSETLEQSLFTGTHSCPRPMGSSVPGTESWDVGSGPEHLRNPLVL